MTVKDLVVSAMEGNAVQFNSIFSNVMSDRIEEFIGSKYESMFSEGYKAKMKEEDDMDDDEDYEDDEEDMDDEDDEEDMDDEDEDKEDE